MGDCEADCQLGLDLDDMVAEERCRASLVDFAGRDHHDQLNDVRLLGFDA